MKFEKIKDGIIIVPVSESTAQNESNIPEWIKTNAGWWADDNIPDSDFINAIQYLVQD